MTKSNRLLARVNFPPYTVHCLTERHILIAGGGGEAKTGIRNVIEIYELINDGDGCRAKSVAHYETGNQAIMNCSVFSTSKYFILFAGMNGTCQLYKLKLGFQEQPPIPNGFVRESGIPSSLKHRVKNNSDEELPHDMINAAEEQAKISEDREIVFDIKPLESFQTDFSEDPFQKLSKFCSTLKILATAGADGHVRVWNFPEMRQIYDIKAHDDDVDDLDFSFTGDKFVSVSRDGFGKVWNSKDGSMVCNLQYELPNKVETKYIYRSCKFALVEDNKVNPNLFITLNPRVRTKPPSPSFLCKFDGVTFALQKVMPTGSEMLSVMAISDDGKFIGIGTQEGSVAIYIAFSLQLLYRAEHVHSIFVTGLEFLQSCEATRHISGGYEASLISISVDNHINVHCVPKRKSFGLFTITIMFTLTLFVVFLLMDYFNL